MVYRGIFRGVTAGVPTREKMALPPLPQQEHFIGKGLPASATYMEGGFFAGVFYDQHQNVLVRTRTFTSRKCLEDYMPYIRLDELEK
jgi:hypothetical protein